MKITIDRGDHEISYTSHAYGKPLVVGTTTRYGMRIKLCDLQRLGWLHTSSVTVTPDSTDALHGHPALDDLVRITRGKRGRYPKAKPSFDTTEDSLTVSVAQSECRRIAKLSDEIDRFSSFMKTGRGLRTVAVAKLREKMYRKQRRRDYIEHAAFLRYCLGDRDPSGAELEVLKAYSKVIGW